MSWKESFETHRVLDGNDIKALAKYIKSKECRSVVLMLGAGIPDFRSPETGLYANLARLNLPYPEAVFDISFFKRNPLPFYTLAHELYPGKFRPTITHSFIRLLSENNKLQRCFTQNIDTLERRAGVPDHKVIEAHGSFATHRCINCKVPYDNDEMKKHVFRKTIPKCPSCEGLVKPDIVFFGESLPPEFSKRVPELHLADLLIVIGTSLTVHPFASLATLPNDLCPRVLINIDKVGDFGTRPDDVVLLGKCDDIVRDLARELGWEDQLLKLWEKTQYSVEEVEELGDQTLVEKVDAEEEVKTLTEKIGVALDLQDLAGKIEQKQKTEEGGIESAEEPPKEDTTSRNELETAAPSEGNSTTSPKTPEQNETTPKDKL